MPRPTRSVLACKESRLKSRLARVSSRGSAAFSCPATPRGLMRAISLGLTLSIGAWVVASLNAQTYAYQSYGAKAGIAVANAIAFDPNGALVAGTNDGVVRFDGFRFEPVPLPG